MNWPATIANSLRVGSSLPAWLNFQRALDRPAEVQQHRLRHLLACNASCAYGREHSFSEIKTYEEFARRVPIVDYENLDPWIDRVRRGEAGVLTSEAVTHLIPTSGSTSARKLIPFTAGLQKEFDCAISPWMVDLARQHPKILFGPAYWCITPVSQTAESGPSAVPIGFADDASYLGGAKAWLARAAMVAPKELGKVHNLEEFRFQTLLCLLRRRDLRLVSVWHPSFLTLLLDALPNHWDKLLAKLHGEDSHRAHELEHVGPQQPESLWPQLDVISCWGDGHAEFSLADLRRRFPNASVQTKGLLATEAFVTIPFGEFHPVAVLSHFFEFMDTQGRLHRVHELRRDETYEVIVTTAGGLWRYRMHDQIQVTGFTGKTPSLRFMARNGNVSDRFGEKLSEAFVATAVQRTLFECGITPRFALLAPDEDAMGWRYTLYVEAERVLPDNTAKILDCALRQNPHYACCRDLGQLQPAGVSVIVKKGYEIYVSRLISKGKRLGDIKPAALSRLPGWSNVFSGSVVPNI